MSFTSVSGIAWRFRLREDNEEFEGTGVFPVSELGWGEEFVKASVDEFAEAISSGGK